MKKRRLTASRSATEQSTARPILAGLFASFAMLIFYFGLLSVANSVSHAKAEFARFWYWVLLLAAGFGMQVGLFVYARARMKMRAAGVAASGGMSGAAMAACCTHHISEFLPLLGLSALATFLVRYQIVFIVIGVMSNLIGILLMLRMIKTHKLYDERGTLGLVLNNDVPMYVIFNIAMAMLLYIALRGGGVL